MVRPEKKLSDEDMAKVERYLHSGFNDRERQPFKPMRLMLMLIVVVISLGALSIGLAKMIGAL